MPEKIGFFNALNVGKWGFVKSKKVWNQIKIWTLKTLLSSHTFYECFGNASVPHIPTPVQTPIYKQFGNTSLPQIHNILRTFRKIFTLHTHCDHTAYYMHFFNTHLPHNAVHTQFFQRFGNTSLPHISSSVPPGCSWVGPCGTAPWTDPRCTPGRW